MVSEGRYQTTELQIRTEGPAAPLNSPQPLVAACISGNAHDVRMLLLQFTEFANAVVDETSQASGTCQLVPPPLPRAWTDAPVRASSRSASCCGVCRTPGRRPLSHGLRCGYRSAHQGRGDPDPRGSPEWLAERRQVLHVSWRQRGVQDRRWRCATAHRGAAWPPRYRALSDRRASGCPKCDERRWRDAIDLGV